MALAMAHTYYNALFLTADDASEYLLHTYV